MANVGPSPGVDGLEIKSFTGVLIIVLVLDVRLLVCWSTTLIQVEIYHDHRLK